MAFSTKKSAQKKQRVASPSNQPREQQSQRMSVLGLSSFFKDEESFSRAFSDSVIRSNNENQNTRKRQNSGENQNGVPQTVMIDDFEFFYEEQKQKMQQQPQFRIEEPSKLMIEEMLEDSRYFLVKGRRHEFLGNRDPIFSLTQAAPHKPPNPSSTCPLCDLNLTSQKVSIHCDFCGCLFCKTCIAKIRPFKSNANLNQSTYSTRSNKQDIIDKGPICLVCDRKHYIRSMLNTTMEAIEGNKLTISRLQGVLQEKGEESKRLDWDLEEYRDVNQGQKLDVKVQKAELKLQRDTLVYELSSINEDCKGQYERTQEITREMRELQETIKDINEDMQRRDEELLKVRIKMTQVDLERQKLEGELQNLRKIIGKQGRGKNATQQTPGKNGLTPKEGSSKATKQISQEIKKAQAEGEDMYFNLASVDQSHDEFMTGSQTHLPQTGSSPYSQHRETFLTQGSGEGDDGGLGLGRESFGSIRAKKQLKKYRRDNQTLCGGQSNSGGKHCSIF